MNLRLVVVAVLLVGCSGGGKSSQHIDLGVGKDLASTEQHDLADEDLASADLASVDLAQPDMVATCGAPGTKRCVNLTPEVCDNTGNWQSSADCPFLCDATSGMCTGMCVPGSKSCDGVTPRTCDATGTWQNGTDCDYVCDATSGACTGTCVPGSTTCDGLQPQKCDATGTYQPNGDACDYVCDATSGACTGMCAPNSVTCSGLQPETCDTTGTFQPTGNACPYVCDATMGACTGVCVPGAIDCADGTHAEVCDATGQWQVAACTQVCSPSTKKCACDSGYTGDGTTCTPIDFCSAPNGGCSPNAKCTQTGITPSCTCNAPNTGDGFSCTQAVVSLNEGFDDITTLAGKGWSLQNSSQAVGSTNWFQGSTIAAGGPFDAYDGATNGYIAANYNNTGNTGTISNWLVTPTVSFGSLAQLTFFTRKATPDTYADRIEVRLCTNATCAPPTDASVGDFTTLLLSVNPSLVLGVYPTSWTQETINNALGLPYEGSGRIAIRYYVTGAGYLGTNSDYIGIDRAGYQAGQPAFTVGGAISGQDASGLVLWLDGSVKVADPGSTFTFPTHLDSNTTYAVSVFAQPTGQTCSVMNASGTIGSADISNVQVVCTDNP